MTAPSASADAAGVQEDPGTPSRGSWRTSRCAGDRPPLLVTIRRYRCTGCGQVWRQDTSRAAEPRARLSRRGLAWALEAIVCQHLSIARVAQGLGVAWNTANGAVLAEGRRVLINDPGRLNGVKVIGGR
jgi:transposase-like protein